MQKSKHSTTQLRSGEQQSFGWQPVKAVADYFARHRLEIAKLDARMLGKQKPVPKRRRASLARGM
jgi:hypothetical protein